MPNDTLLYLIRHGVTAANEGGVLQGRGVDNPLSDFGKAQANRTAYALAEFPLQAVYASPLLRAQETAAAIAEPHDGEVTTVNELAEVHVGRWEGRTWAQIEADEPDAYRQFVDTEGDVGYPEGETFTQVFERVSGALNPLYERHEGESFAVVAHSVVNRCYLATLLGREPHRGRDVLQGNCGVNVIRRREGKLRIVTLNSALHLHGV
ncbi:histidine phosphatase family protein [Adhaeretor mobilis]|uniref:Phosphoserine phosphatase 1 n=1 Tax=Adhaeretor mobilis TaxID=1930276 RepID=A0A517N0A7_9BACT|nr:histidine phosphatase family protein [Adhaeretor mobilis]QDT00563.1 Phosphoserine phosphatase 1 [Adhaeretor mobilis]